MSFILDALRKAENRKRDDHGVSVPTGPRVLIDDTPEPPPNWRNIIVLGVVGLALLGAGVVFGLRETPTENPLPDDTTAGNLTTPNSFGNDTGMNPAGRAPGTIASAPERAVSNDASPLAPTEYRTRDTGARALDREAAKSQVQRTAEPTTRAATAAAAPAVSTVPAAARARVRNESLPDYLSIVQSGQVGLPQLHLDMHVYSAMPEKRLVFINLDKFRTGDKLDANTTIESIEPDGVIIDHKGLRFILRPD